MKYNPFKFTVILFFLAIGSSSVYADSPITSTTFYSAYMDVDIVEKASLTGTLSTEMADFLMDDANLIDHKAALVNALGWDYYGKSNAVEYKKRLAQKYKTEGDNLDLDKLTAGELMSLGYMMALDNYNDVSSALLLLKKAVDKDKGSFTVNMIYTIVKAQTVSDDNWCEIWRLTRNVINNKSLFKDLKTQSCQLIVDYMILYKDYCDPSYNTY
jgi:hypothetical protein